MVRRKDEPKPTDWLSDQLQRYNRENPIVETRYFVVEVSPGYTEPGHYGRNIAQRKVRVSPYFDTKQEALDWFAEHDPDPGNWLKVVEQHKRRFVTERWV